MGRRRKPTRPNVDPRTLYSTASIPKPKHAGPQPQLEPEPEEPALEPQPVPEPEPDNTQQHQHASGGWTGPSFADQAAVAALKEQDRQLRHEQEELEREKAPARGSGHLRGQPEPEQPALEPQPEPEPSAATNSDSGSECGWEQQIWEIWEQHFENDQLAASSARLEVATPTAVSEMAACASNGARRVKGRGPSRYAMDAEAYANRWFCAAARLTSDLVAHPRYHLGQDFVGRGVADGGKLPKSCARQQPHVLPDAARARLSVDTEAVSRMMRNCIDQQHKGEF